MKKKTLTFRSNEDRKVRVKARIFQIWGVEQVQATVHPKASARTIDAFLNIAKKYPDVEQAKRILDVPVNQLNHNYFVTSQIIYDPLAFHCGNCSEPLNLREITSPG